MTNICMLFQGTSPHPAHRAFGDAVECTYIHFESGKRIDRHSPGGDTGIRARISTGIRLPNTIDVLIAEGTAPLQTALVYGAFRNRAAMILYLAADETFYTLNTRMNQYLWRVLKPITSRILDGCIGVSDRAVEWYEPYLGIHPVEIVHPPIPDETFDRLRQLEPASPDDPFSIVSIGAYRENKNHATLATAVCNLASRHDREITLTVVGEGHDEAPYASDQHVEVSGFVSTDRFVRILAGASVYVQPSTADAYPVATLEAMLSATPTIVGTNVGTGHLLPKSQVCEPSITGIQRAITHLMNKTLRKRETIGKEHRESVGHLTVTNQQARFAAAIDELERSSRFSHA